MNASVRQGQTAFSEPPRLATKAFACPTREDYRQVFQISMAKYISRRGPGGYPSDPWAWFSLRNCIVCLLKLGFLAQAHCVCLVLRRRLEREEAQYSPIWMSLVCYEVICHHEAGQNETAEAWYSIIRGRALNGMEPHSAEDVDVLEWYRSRKSIHCLVLRHARDPWEGVSISHYGQVVDIEGGKSASNLSTVNKVRLSNDGTQWRNTTIILRSPDASNEYRQSNPLKLLAESHESNGSAKSHPSESDSWSVRPHSSQLNLGGSLVDLMPLKVLGSRRTPGTNNYVCSSTGAMEHRTRP